jgi:hypothetical protein
LIEDENGNAVIGRLQAGGPAFQSGNLHAGDKILTVRWDDKEPIDVSGASLEETQQILAAEGGSRLMLTVKKSDGTTRDVSLQKQKLATSEDDEDKVKGFILKGRPNGRVYFPAGFLFGLGRQQRDQRLRQRCRQRDPQTEKGEYQRIDPRPEIQWRRIYAGSRRTGRYLHR